MRVTRNNNREACDSKVPCRQLSVSWYFAQLFSIYMYGSMSTHENFKYKCVRRTHARTRDAHA
jgi:hypothetical protein